MSRHLPPGSQEFSRLFDEFRHTAYRLETLQEYREPTEAQALAAFQAGQEPTIYPGKRQWISLVNAAKAAGKVMKRVHVVIEPLSAYLQYEIGWSYGLNVEAGEDVRILPAAEHAWPEELPRFDYWLFDSQTLALMHYSADGRMTGIEIVSNPADIVQACYWRDVGLHAAIPHGEYLSVTGPPLRFAS